MIPNQPSLDAGPLFVQGVAYAMSHQMDRVIADKGTDYFLSLQKALGGMFDWAGIQLRQ